MEQRLRERIKGLYKKKSEQDDSIEIVILLDERKRM